MEVCGQGDSMKATEKAKRRNRRIHVQSSGEAGGNDEGNELSDGEVHERKLL
jgi:hypothetical protein